MPPAVAPTAKATASPCLDACDVARLACLPVASVTTSWRARLFAASARLVDAPGAPGDGSHRAVSTAGAINPDCADAVAPDAIDNIRKHGAAFIIDARVSLDGGCENGDAPGSTIALRVVEWPLHGTARDGSRVWTLAEGEAAHTRSGPRLSEARGLWSRFLPMGTHWFHDLRHETSTRLAIVFVNER
jgi:hypothetical protein